MKPLIVIPTYNNRPTLKDVVERALATGLDTLVVDDGGDDGGAETLRDLTVSIERLPRNEGKGAAIRHGARWAAERGYTHAITIDADGQHNPAEIPSLVARARSDARAIVIGARDMRSAGAPYLNRCGLALSNFWFRAITGVAAPDTQSGFRVYPVDALIDFSGPSRGYDFEVEVLAEAIRAGRALKNAPISVVYSPETRAASRFRVWRDNWRFCRLYCRLALAAWARRRRGRRNGVAS